MAFANRKQRVKNANPIIIDGIRWSSESEAYYYTLLKERLEKEEIWSFECQVNFELQPQFKKCSAGCGFMWDRPILKKDPNYERYRKSRKCPECDAELFLVREMTYVADFVVQEINHTQRIIDVKSSPFFQTEIFHHKKKLFERKFPDCVLEMVFPKVPKGWGKLMRLKSNQE